MHTDYLKHCSCIVSTLCVALASVAALHNGASGYRVQLYLILTLKWMQKQVVDEQGGDWDPISKCPFWAFTDFTSFEPLSLSQKWGLLDIFKEACEHQPPLAHNLTLHGCERPKWLGHITSPSAFVARSIYFCHLLDYERVGPKSSPMKVKHHIDMMKKCLGPWFLHKGL